MFAGGWAQNLSSVNLSCEFNKFEFFKGGVVFRIFTFPKISMFIRTVTGFVFYEGKQVVFFMNLLEVLD